MANFYSVLALISVVLYYILAIGISIRVVVKRRVVGVSLAWLMVIYSLPFVGVAAYLMFGELNLGRKRAERADRMFEPYGEWFRALDACEAHQPTKISREALPIHQLCEQQLNIPSLSGNTLSLLTAPDEIMLAMIEDIEKAKHTIHLEFYIWHPGGLANDVGKALLDAAARGVKIKLLLDSAGSLTFFRSAWPKTFKAAGIEVVEALAVSPWRMFLRRMDLRQHRKIVVIDNKVGYTGSMNLVDPRYFKADAGVGHWVDIMVRITGPNVAVLNAIQAWDWEVETGKRALPPIPQCGLEKTNEYDAIMTIPSGPGMPDAIIHKVLSLAIYQARDSITITTPYFVPSEALHYALLNAAQRGVEVNIILPKHNDSIMVRWASRSFFHDLLSAGVTIHQFDGGLLHTKSVVIDKKHCLIGTVNLDMRSLWLNFELTLAIDDREFTKQMIWLQQKYIDESETVDQARWQLRTVKDRFLEHFFYLFSPLL
ncbi:cardiolipin synthase [Thaumasiovibrio subtropicus]|uniref:cardiolipin synthase n=1 Tax=Thaumasiovibrio subtropicus TaxID=1891207 RepID=UPI000B356C9B|nr:cardiolipin synthase [Thaumasiovibrio subtropicus]